MQQILEPIPIMTGTLEQQAVQLHNHLLRMAVQHLMAFKPDQLQQWMEGLNNGSPLEISLKLRVSPTK